MTVVFFVWPADALAAQIITTAYGMPAVDRIQIPAMRPHRLDQGNAVKSISGEYLLGLEDTYLEEGYLKGLLGYTQWVRSMLGNSGGVSVSFDQIVWFAYLGVV